MEYRPLLVAFSSFALLLCTSASRGCVIHANDPGASVLVITELSKTESVDEQNKAKVEASILQGLKTIQDKAPGNKLQVAVASVREIRNDFSTSTEPLRLLLDFNDIKSMGLDAQLQSLRNPKPEQPPNTLCHSMKSARSFLTSVPGNGRNANKVLLFITDGSLYELSPTCSADRLKNVSMAMEQEDFLIVVIFLGNRESKDYHHLQALASDNLFLKGGAAEQLALNGVCQAATGKSKAATVSASTAQPVAGSTSPGGEAHNTTLGDISHVEALTLGKGTGVSSGLTTEETGFEELLGISAGSSRNVTEAPEHSSVLANIGGPSVTIQDVDHGKLVKEKEAPKLSLIVPNASDVQHGPTANQTVRDITDISTTKPNVNKTASEGGLHVQSAKDPLKQNTPSPALAGKGVVEQIPQKKHSITINANESKLAEQNSVPQLTLPPLQNVTGNNLLPHKSPKAEVLAEVQLNLQNATKDIQNKRNGNGSSAQATIDAQTLAGRPQPTAPSHQLLHEETDTQDLLKEWIITDLNKSDPEAEIGKPGPFVQNLTDLLPRHPAPHTLGDQSVAPRSSTVGHNVSNQPQGKPKASEPAATPGLPQFPKQGHSTGMPSSSTPFHKHPTEQITPHRDVEVKNLTGDNNGKIRNNEDVPHSNAVEVGPGAKPNDRAANKHLGLPGENAITSTNQSNPTNAGVQLDLDQQRTGNVPHAGSRSSQKYMNVEATGNHTDTSPNASSPKADANDARSLPHILDENIRLSHKQKGHYAQPDVIFAQPVEIRVGKPPYVEVVAKLDGGVSSDVASDGTNLSI